MFLQNKADRNSEDTHDGNIIEGHAHIFWVIKGRNLDVPRFPSQKGTK